MAWAYSTSTSGFSGLVDQTFEETNEAGEKFWAYGGDYGPDYPANDSNFCANGLVQPDRTINPTIWEVKKVYQSIEVEPVDLTTRTVVIRNEYDFTSLSAFDFSWEVMGDGEQIAEGPLRRLNVSPKSVVRLRVPWTPISPEPGVEYFLAIRATTAEAKPLVPQGHEVAWAQFKLPLSKEAEPLDVPSLPALTLDDQPEVARLESEAFALVFDKQAGVIQSLQVQGTELVRTGLVPHFWRAPIDNDLGNGMPIRLGVWKEAGANRQVNEVDVAQPDAQTVQISVAATLPAGGSSYVTRYTIYGSGDIIVEGMFEPGSDDLPELPRFGMTMTMPGAFTNLSWFGRGPHESYWDRKTGAAVGVYEGAVWDQYHDYSRPQENGNKTDVRWIALSNEAGVGLMAVGLPLLSASAHQFLNEDLDHVPGAQRHGIDVKPRDLVTLNLDYKQMGVGGDNSWGAQTHPEYTLPAQPYAYRFRLRPFTPDDPSPAVLSRQGV